MPKNARDIEKVCFTRAFLDYILNFIKESGSAEMKSDISGTVYFVFAENGLKTTRRFEEDLIFSYKIAEEAILEWSEITKEFVVEKIDDGFIKIVYLGEE